MTVRIGIIGSGLAAALHAEGLRQVRDADIVAAASPNPEHVWEFHRRFAVPHAFKEYRDMLDGDLVDAVTIACPNDLHCEAVLAAAAARKHVFVDEPLALSLADCDRMIEACREAGVILMYGENLCFAPQLVRAKELADEGALGHLYYVRKQECRRGPRSDWSWDMERSGGGVLMDTGPHSIAFCRWMFANAPVESVYAELGRFVHQERTQADDHALVAMRFAGGGIGVAESSWARAGGLEDRAEVYGSQGLTIADLARGSALQTYASGGYAYAPSNPDAEKAPRTRGWSWTSFEEAWNYGFPQEMAHFVECVQQGRQPQLTGEDGRAVLEIICAAYESARTGQRVSLPFQTDAEKPIDLWL